MSVDVFCFSFNLFPLEATLCHRLHLYVEKILAGQLPLDPRAAFGTELPAYDTAVERDSLTERRAMDAAARHRASCW